MQKVIIFISLLAAVVRFVDAQASATYSCPTNFTYDTSNAYCYSVEKVATKTWDAASTDCVDQGGYLARFGSSTEYDAFMADYIGTAYWFGAKDTTSTDVFLYTDGSPISHTDWVFGEPINAATDDCIEIKTDKYWITSNCSQALGYICEADPLANVTCDTDWVMNPTEAEGINACYQFIKTPVDFATAAAACVANRTTLFRAETQAEHDYVYTTMASDMWNDATDITTEGTFVSFTFTNTTALFAIPWNTNEPNDCGTNEDCTIIFGTGGSAGKVNDVDCTDTYNYVCKVIA